MSEESAPKVQEEVSAPEEPIDETPAPKEPEEPPQLTVEEIATQIGWNPNHTGEEAVDAATFIIRGREIQQKPGRF